MLFPPDMIASYAPHGYFRTLCPASLQALDTTSMTSEAASDERTHPHALL